MRKIFLLLISCPLFLQAQLLYEISGNGSANKSYLLATNKFVSMAFLDTIPNVYKCFDKCDKVVCEFVMEDYQALSALRQAALLPDTIKLESLYSKKELEQIDQALQRTLEMRLEQFYRIKPSYLTELYRNELMKQWLDYDEKNTMENAFQWLAQTKNMPVYGLDDVGETLYMIFDREPMQWQAKELLNIIENPEKEVRQERTIREMYLYGRLYDIAFQIYSPDNQTVISYSDYQVFIKRNTQWVKRLQPYLKDGKAFITLNAMYLGGDEGLIAQLKKAGYRVRAVNR